MARKKHHPGEEPTIPATARPAYDAVVALTDAFCREHLDEEYEALCRKLAGALAIQEQMQGPDHPKTALSLNNLAWLYDNQGRYDEAEPLYRRALAIWEKALGLEHPHTVIVLVNYARLLRALGREDEAKAMEARARAGHEAHAQRNATPG